MAPHAVCIPYPAQGHITPMLKLTNILHYYNFHITFVNTEYNHRRLLKTQGPDALAGLPDFHFKTIPDGLPPSSDEDVTQDISALCQSSFTNFLPYFRELMQKLSSQDSGVPPVTVIIADANLTFALDAAEELGIPCVLFWTASACSLLGYLQYQQFLDRGLVPLKDESYLSNGYLDTPIDWVPGMKNMRFRDFPSFIQTCNKDDFMLNYAIKVTSRFSQPTAMILNTFEELECSALEELPKFVAPVYTIGPLQLLVPQFPTNPPLPVGSNLWKEEPECLKWLQGKKPSSVVYVNFGSITIMTNKQLVEFAWGLADSGYDFLWIIRRDLVKGEAQVLPQEFIDEVKDRGLLASWCQQEEVLREEAIGGFLTHSGWNSTLEAICGGAGVELAIFRGPANELQVSVQGLGDWHGDR